MAQREQLGFVTCQSGILVFIDTGYLNVWSHDKPPLLPQGALDSDNDTKRANAFVDLQIVGRDAEKAGQLLEMSMVPLYVFDQPPEDPDLRVRFDNIVRQYGLESRMETLPERVSHRKRVDLALQNGSGAGEVQFHGVGAAVVAGIPTARQLKVCGERASGPQSDRWKTVTVECNPDLEIERSEIVGSIGVDYARILIADVDSLGSWQHEESLDGMADFVFWGKDAEKLARSVKAPSLDQEQFGWLNIEQGLALELGNAAEESRKRNGYRLATDYRPHSHHWRVMKASRTTPTESGMTEVGGTTVCNFMTTWGDGVFDVYRDMTSNKELVQIRVEMQNSIT